MEELSHHGRSTLTEAEAAKITTLS